MASARLSGQSRFRKGLPTRSAARLFTDKQGKDEAPHFELLPYRDKGEQHVSGLLHYYDTAIDLKNKGCSSEAFSALSSSSCLSLADRCFCPLWNWQISFTWSETSPVSWFCLKRRRIELCQKKKKILIMFCNCVYKWSKSALCVCVFNYCKDSVEDWRYRSSVWCWRCEQEVRMLKRQVRWYQVTSGLIPRRYITPSLSSSPTQESKLDPHHLYLYWTQSYITCHTARMWFISDIYLLIRMWMRCVNTEPEKLMLRYVQCCRDVTWS